jgi:hypothetical protein
MKKKKAFGVFLLATALAFTSCQKRDEQAYFQPLADFLTAHGYGEYALEPLADQAGNTSVPIYDATVWHSLRIGTEELLVYFDSSNRAKQLADQFCREDESQKVIYVGLRFIICYAGADEGIIALMDEWQKENPA